MKMQSGKAFLSIVLLAAILATSSLAIGVEAAIAKPLTASIISPATGSTLKSPVNLTEKVTGGMPPYSYRWIFHGGTPGSIKKQSSHLRMKVKVRFPDGIFATKLTVIGALTEFGKNRTLRLFNLP
jgi:hypothetical protein